MRYCFDWEDISGSPLELVLVTCNQEGQIVGKIERLEIQDGISEPNVYYKFIRIADSSYNNFYQHAYTLEEAKAIAEVTLKKAGYTLVEKPRDGKLKIMF